MCRTKHMQQRMSQRRITSEIVKMVGIFGIYNGDIITMTGMNCEFLSNVPAKFKRTLDKIAQKGSCTVVNRGRSLITAFRVDSFNRNLAE